MLVSIVDTFEMIIGRISWIPAPVSVSVSDSQLQYTTDRQFKDLIGSWDDDSDEQALIEMSI